jgi:hypothetical protein
MIQLDWKVFAWFVLALAILKGIITGLTNLYSYIYKAGYTLGRKTMESEDTTQLLKAIQDVKAEMPESELALVLLWSKLVGGETKKEEKKSEERVIGFGKPEPKKEEKNA